MLFLNKCLKKKKTPVENVFLQQSEQFTFMIYSHRCTLCFKELVKKKQHNEVAIIYKIIVNFYYPSYRHLKAPLYKYYFIHYATINPTSVAVSMLRTDLTCVCCYTSWSSAGMVTLVPLLQSPSKKFRHRVGGDNRHKKYFFGCGC